MDFHDEIHGLISVNDLFKGFETQRINESLI